MTGTGIWLAISKCLFLGIKTALPSPYHHTNALMSQIIKCDTLKSKRAL